MSSIVTDVSIHMKISPAYMNTNNPVKPGFLAGNLIRLEDVMPQAAQAQYGWYKNK